MVENVCSEIVNWYPLNQRACPKLAIISRDSNYFGGHRATRVDKHIPRSQRGGQGFKSPQLHSTETIEVGSIQNGRIHHVDWIPLRKSQDLIVDIPELTVELVLGHKAYVRGTDDSVGSAARRGLRAVPVVAAGVEVCLSEERTGKQSPRCGVCI